jgi:hypothetical protein
MTYLLIFAMLLSLSSCVYPYSAALRETNNSGLHAEYGTVIRESGHSFTAASNGALIGISQACIELPTIVEEPFLASVDIDYPLRGSSDSLLMVFPGGVFHIFPDAVSLRHETDDANAILERRKPLGINMLQSRNMLMVYKDHSFARAFLNGFLMDTLPLSGSTSKGRIKVGFSNIVGVVAEAKFSNFSIVTGEIAVSAYQTAIKRSKAK